MFIIMYFQPGVGRSVSSPENPSHVIVADSYSKNILQLDSFEILKQARISKAPRLEDLQPLIAWYQPLWEAPQSTHP